MIGYRAVALIVFVLGLFACGVPQKGARYSGENVLRIDVDGPFQSLDPLDAQSASNYVFPLLFSYLCVPNEQGILEQDLAVSWKYDPASFTWTIRLRPDARFHNGSPVTSGDVRHSLLTILSRHRFSLYEKIKEIVPVTETSLRLVLRENDPDFLYSIRGAEIVPESGSADGRGAPIGSGPFRYSYRLGSGEIGLVANQDYFGGPPAIDRVVFHAVPDSEKSLARLLGGKTDIAVNLDPYTYSVIQEYQHLFQTVLFPGTSQLVVLYNTRHPMFNDPRVRTALTMAVDRTDLVESVLSGNGSVTAGPVAADSPYHDPDTVPLPYDPSKALELLRTCGLLPDQDNRGYLHKAGTPFDFDLLVPEGNQLYARVAAYLRLAWNGVGIKVRLRYLSMDRIAGRCRESGDFHAILKEMRCARGSAALETLKSAWFPGMRDGPMVGGLEDMEVTRLMREADEMGPKRLKLIRMVDARIASLQPATFLFSRMGMDAMSRRVRLPFPMPRLDATFGLWKLRHAYVVPEEKKPVKSPSLMAGGAP